MAETINFADIEDQKEFSPLPRGRYVLEITDQEDRYAGENSKNPGARMLNWEFSVRDNEDYQNQKTWDLQVCVPTSLFKAKALFTAAGVDTNNLSYNMDEQAFYIVDEDGDNVELDVQDLVGKMVEAKIKIQPATREQEARNQITAFYPHESEDDELLG